MASTGGEQGRSQFCSVSEGFAFKAVGLLLSALSSDRAVLGGGSRLHAGPHLPVFTSSCSPLPHSTRGGLCGQ